MNNVFIQMLLGSVVRNTLMALAGSLATLGLLGVGDKAEFVKIGSSLVLGGATLAWSFLQKKQHANAMGVLDEVPQPVKAAAAVKAGVILPLLFFFVVVMLLSSSAFAADLVAKKKVVILPTTPVCTLLQCVNKFYVGGGLAGVGTNANIVGNGLQGSVFAGGGVPFVDAGWMTWNGIFFLGAEVGAGYQLNVGSTVNGANSNEGGYMAYQEVQVGGALAQIFGNAPPPLAAPSGLSADLMTLYVAAGAEEHSFATGWRTGAGMKFLLPNSNIILDLGYRYTNFGAATDGAVTFNAINLVYAKFDVPLN